MVSQKIKNRTQLASFIAIIAGFIVVFNYLTSKVFLRLDLTEKKQYSISNVTKRMLKNLDDIINIKVYFSRNLPAHLKILESDVRDLLSEYKIYAGKNLRIAWEDPSKDEETKNRARQLGIPEIQMQTFEKDKAAVQRGFLGIAVLYEDKKEVLPVVQDLSTFEYDLTTAIMKVGRKEIPKVGILKTDTMPFLPMNIRMQMNMKDQTEEKYKPLFENLRTNYSVETVDISEGKPIDASIKTLIVPGGEDFTERRLFEIDQYFMNGGNLIVLVDAVKIEMQWGVRGTATNSPIIKLLEHYGARVETDMVLDASCGNVTVPQNFGMFQMQVQVPYPFFVRVIESGFNKDNAAVSGLGEMILPWTSSITLLVDTTSKDSGAVKANVLVKSSAKSWTVTDFFNLMPQQDWKPAKEQLKPHNLALHLSGNFKSYFAGKSIPPVSGSTDTTDTLSKIKLSPEDQNRTIVQSNTNRHLVVVGDADFLSGQYAMQGNIAFILNLVDWLTLDENLISIRSRTQVDRTLNADQLKEGSITTAIIRYVNIFGMSIIVVVIGLVIFFKRRNALKSASVLSTMEKQN